MSEEKKSTSKRRKVKRELIEWGVLLGIIGILYLTGWHTEVIGRIQQVLLWTGVMQPQTELPEGEQIHIRYDMPLLSLDGSRTDLESFRDKVIFLNFWATWCAPCIAEMPSIQKLYEELDQEAEIVFLLVSLDESTDKVREFIKRKGFTFPVYMLAGPRPAELRSGVVPTTFVISRKGIIVAKREGMAKYHTDHFKQFLIEQVNSGS